MMTTWRDYLLNKCYTHTWMVYIPGIPLDLDYPEILGLRVPQATLVQNNNEDELFTIGEMQRADSILHDVYAKAALSIAISAHSIRARTNLTAPCRRKPSAGSSAG